MTGGGAVTVDAMRQAASIKRKPSGTISSGGGKAAGPPTASGAGSGRKLGLLACFVHKQRTRRAATGTTTRRGGLRSTLHGCRSCWGRKNESCGNRKGRPRLIPCVRYARAARGSGPHPRAPSGGPGPQGERVSSHVRRGDGQLRGKR